MALEPKTVQYGDYFSWLLFDKSRSKISPNSLLAIKQCLCIGPFILQKSFRMPDENSFIGQSCYLLN